MCQQGSDMAVCIHLKLSVEQIRIEVSFYCCKNLRLSCPQEG